MTPAPSAPGMKGMSANTSTVNFLLQCITYGITVVYTDTFAFGPAVLQNDIHSLGLKDFFVVGGSIWAYDQVHAQYLLSPGEAENLVLPLPVTWWSETDAPSIGRAKQIAGQAGRTGIDARCEAALQEAAVHWSGLLLGTGDHVDGGWTSDRHVAVVAGLVRGSGGARVFCR